jgi:DinB superfamily
MQQDKITESVRKDHAMQETVQQYIQRMLGYVGGQEPLKIQAGTPKKIERLLKGASGSKLRKRPAPGKWSVAEILAHLGDTELVSGYRIRAILGAPGTPIAAFDQDAWAAALHYEKRDPRKSLAQFRGLREANLALLKTLAREQWENHGVHAERGKETIAHIARMMAGHDLNHLGQIERILAPKKASSIK